MKEYLDAEKLKSMKREEVQALAKDLGLNAGGKTEEIIERIRAEAEAQAEAETQAEAEAQVKAETQAAGMATVRIIERFLDKQLNQIKEVGETYQVKKERAAELVAAGVAEIQK